MPISIFCAWIAAICTLLTAVKFFAKYNKTLNRIFHKLHIPVGIALLGAGLIHGLFAGNRPAATLGEASIGTQLFTLNMGTVCLVLAAALGLTYVFRKQLKRRWMQLHRVLTVCLLAALFIHVVQVGITLPDVVKGMFSADNGTSASVTATAAPATETAAGTEQITLPAAEETTASSQQADAATADAAAETTVPVGNDGNMSLTFSGATLQDGVYQGSAEGYRSTITLSVTVAGGQVTQIDVVSQQDTPDFFNRAKAIIEDIIGEQSLNVDAVSGATYSSRGILQAVYNALSGAVTSGELQVTLPTPQQGHKGHH